MSTTTRRRQRAQPKRVNGKDIPNKVEATPDQFTDAQAIEAEIAATAEEIRGDATELTPDLFMKLWPLLRRPIPGGFLVDTSKGEGKPYDSIGVRSVQVQHDRMDNVLSPMWWYPETVYESGGKICHVTIVITVTGDRPIVRDAWGGINRGSTDGNLYKGSYTNAAKLAFARIGPGHEVYLGATDFDPDVNPDAAREQVAPPPQPTAGAPVHDGQPITAEKAADLAHGAFLLGLLPKLPLALMHVTGAEAGEVASEADATNEIGRLTPMQAARLERWLNKKANEETGDA